MEVRIGDNVRFLNQTGGGKVVKIVNNNTVMVLDEDEFEIPTAISNLVVIQSDFKTEDGNLTSTTAHLPKDEPKIISESTNTNKFYLAFLSKNLSKSGSDVDCYVVNDTKDIIFYTFYKQSDSRTEGVSSGRCNAGERMIVASYSAKDLNDIKHFSLHIIGYKKEGEPHMPIVYKMNVNPVKFFKNSSFKENKIFSENAIIYDIEDKDSVEYKLYELSEREDKKLLSVKETVNAQGIPVIKTKDEALEVDLHINKLIDSVVGLSNREILTYQLDKFNEVMEENRYKKGQRVVFIHGLGNGTLKQKLIWELDHKYKTSRHQEASFQKYGSGATMVVM
jgi:hypothetical protein